MYGISLGIVFSYLIISTFCETETGTIIDKCRDVVFNCKCGFSGYVFQAVFKQCHYWLPPEQACTRYQHCSECQTGMRKCLACPLNRYGEQCAGVKIGKPYCERPKEIPCVGMQMETAEIQNDQFPVMSVISYFCCKHHELVGVSNQTCLDTGEWSDQQPKCVSRIELDNPSDDKSSWLVAIGQSSNIISCGGIVLSNDWIITDAHCLANESRRANKGEPELKVYIGSLQSNNAAEFVEEISVKRIVYHPDYDSSSANSNIALILLEEPITAPIQPCLLTRKSFSHFNVRVGRVGMAISWRKGSDNFFSGVMDGRNLTVLSSDDCSNLHRNKIGEIPEFSNETFCAGFPNKQYSVCEWGNGGFILFPVSYGNTVLWYLEGIMKWKCEGGGEGGFYGGFIKVVNFLPWIEGYVNQNESQF